MHMTHIIIDDFFDNPMAVRQQVLAMTYPPKPERAYYPGRNAAKAFPLPGIDRLISQIVQEPLKPAPNYSYGFPRLALADDESKASVHLDFCHWSAMIYLSLDEHARGGTHFFRHKQTGWDMAPVFPGIAEKAGYKNSDEAVQSILKQDGNDPTKWDETFMIPMKFNRLAIFRGYLWHDAGLSFGTTPETGRLILPVFLENTNPQ